MDIYLDTGDLKLMEQYEPYVQGFTTNPSLMKAAGITSYIAFAEECLKLAKGKPISFEVITDSIDEMAAHANLLDDWGPNVYVKIPVTDSEGQSTGWLIEKLSRQGIKVNVTAVMTLPQIRGVARMLDPKTPAILSIFAGRIADTGWSPYSFFTAALQCKHANTKVLWASTRELYNVTEARQLGVDIITVSPALFAKRHLIGKDLGEYSIETVRQFNEDSKGLTL